MKTLITKSFSSSTENGTRAKALKRIVALNKGGNKSL